MNTSLSNVMESVNESESPIQQRHAGQGHHRQSSDPTTNTASVDADQMTTERRNFFERGWSTSDLHHGDRTNRHAEEGRRTSTSDMITEANEDYDSEIRRKNKKAMPRLSLSPADLLHFHQSWTTTNGEDLFGASMSFPVTTPFVESHHLDRPDMPRRLVSSPRVNSLGVSSAIHDAARITNWDEVLRLCQSNPAYATYSGRDRWTALHHACNRRCPYPHVVEALIKASPDALLQEEEKGWLPLHYACRFKAPKEVVRLLLYMYPEKGKKAVSSVDRVRRTPLYYAIRYDAPPGVVGLLLEIDPAAVLEEDHNSESPLALVWDSWVEKLEGKRIVNSLIPGGFPEQEQYSPKERASVLQASLKREPKLYKRWIQANMLLKAAFGFPVDEGGKDEKPSAHCHNSTGHSEDRIWRVVHATAAVKVHPTLFLLACALYPEQVRELDRADLYPMRARKDSSTAHQTALHLAASSNAGGEPGKTILLELLREYREAAEMQDGYDGSLPLHRMVENEKKQDWTNHAAILHRFFTGAVQKPDYNGKLPLHRAAKAIKHNVGDEQDEESIILQLVRVFPLACSHMDKEGCFPFHLIAGHAEIWDNAVEAVYNVHRVAVTTRAGDEHFNRLPLHMAAANTRSRESLISRLVQLNPRGASMADRQGKLPLHLACEIGKDWQAGVNSIHAAFTDAVFQPETNERGWLPLHMAANSSNTTPNLIEKLVELNSDAAGVSDAQGRYPLHLACHSGKTWSGGLKILFDASPSVMGTPDASGLYPFYLASLHFCKPDIEDTEEVDIFTTSKATNQLGATSAAELDILFNILKADPTVVSNFN